MKLSELQSQKLFKLTQDIFLNVKWTTPLEGEREPEYTARILAPFFRTEVARLRHLGLVVRADGTITAQAVMFDTARHYPDMAVNYHFERVGAIEVKFIDEFLSGQAYLTALGQGLLYSSMGYKWSVVVLVGKTKGATVSQDTLDALNENLRTCRVSVISLLWGGNSDSGNSEEPQVPLGKLKD